MKLTYTAQLLLKNDTKWKIRSESICRCILGPDAILVTIERINSVTRSYTWNAYKRLICNATAK